MYFFFSAFLPPAVFMFGDPHFKSVDNQNFTFNGIGEYIFIRTPPSLDFSVQARLESFSSNVTGTIMTAIAVKQGDMQTVQVVAEGGQMNVYIAGTRHELATGDSPLIVDASGVVSSDLSGGIGSTMEMAMSTDMVFVRMDDSGNIVVSTADGASVSVSLQDSFLGISVSLPSNFSGDLTSGLLGTFNGDPSDDFRNTEGEVLTLNSEAEIYNQFGLLCEWSCNSYCYTIYLE